MGKIYFYDYWYDKDDIDYDDLKREYAKQFTAEIEKEDLSAMAEGVSAIIIRELRDNNWGEFGEGDELYIAFKEQGADGVMLYKIKEVMVPSYVAEELVGENDE
ncbi:hypothetical protein [Glaesserella parasuis]|uniref:hypothetical protein n=1 Tax=Glaesserella parasuis TaxID=738 RepID=UPI001321ACBF|nr:hypothetical protein [Glaesserella parasuis]MDO9856155.1 hypothetical protein [Glaesserella parasuis]MDO9982874.1 hypothetical protein [Glaesserella parasuis]MDP0260748.1 hypothetical protein [Glaesserella parasuis]MWP87912.1 hypothetical protein [Glaesserella parasuis]